MKSDRECMSLKHASKSRSFVQGIVVSGRGIIAIERFGIMKIEQRLSEKQRGRQQRTLVCIDAYDRGEALKLKLQKRNSELKGFAPRMHMM